MMQDVQGKTQGTYNGVDELLYELEELRGGMQDAHTMTTGELIKPDDSLEVAILSMQEEMMEFAEMHTEITELAGLRVEMIHVEGGNTFQPHPRLDVHRHNKFKGSQFAKDVDNILYNIENYFQAKGVEDDISQLGMIFSYLQDMVLLCWCQKRDY